MRVWGVALRGGFTVRCCTQLVKYVKCLPVAMQLPFSKWRPFLKICMSGKTRKILEKLGNLVGEKSTKPVMPLVSYDTDTGISCIT